MNYSLGNSKMITWSCACIP